MIIGIVTTWFERGAAHVSRQFKDVLDADNEVLIYARGGEEYAIGDPNWDHDYVTWAPPADTYAFSDIKLSHFRKWIEDNNIECVLFNEQKIWAPVFLCRELGVLAGAYIDYYTEQTVPMFNAYDFLICNTKRHHSVFTEHPQALYIPWGTNTKVYTLKEQSKSSTEQVTFFHSAGMSPFRKGTDMVIKAFERLKSDAKLIIHTQVKLTEAFPELTSTIDTLVNNQRIELHEYTTGAPGLFHLGDVYVYPSRLDGIGLTIMEAAASGLPVITSDNGPMNEFIVDGENGLNVRLEKLWSRWDGYYWPQCEVNVDALSMAMESYAKAPERMKSLKEHARKYATTHFDWTTNTANMHEQISNLKPLPNSIVSKAKKACLAYDKKLFDRHAKTLRQRLHDDFRFNNPSIYNKLQRLKRTLFSNNSIDT